MQSSKPIWPGRDTPVASRLMTERLLAHFSVPALVLAALAMACPPMIAQTGLAEPVWSHDLTDSAFSSLGTVSVSPSGAVIVVDVLRQTMQFMPDRSAAPVMRAVRGRILDWIADTAVILDQPNRVSLYTADGTLRRIVSATLVSQRTPGREPTIPKQGRAAIQSVGPGDTIAISTTISAGMAREFHGIDGIVWWQSSGGPAIAPPLTVPQTDCVVTLPDRDGRPTLLPPHTAAVRAFPTPCCRIGGWQ